LERKLVGQERAKQIDSWMRGRGRNVAIDCSIRKGEKVKRMRIMVRKL
jgi:hypothetical protein